MKTELSNKIKQNKAFTLMETLLVVGMVVILSGVSIFGVSKVMESLGGMELDSYAKTVFMEAQNQLTAMKVEGTLAEYAADIKAEDMLGAEPSDYTGEENCWNAYCYLNKEDGRLQKIIPVTSDIYTDDGTYVVEFNPQTGNVYGVFYSKDSGFTYSIINETLIGTEHKDLRKDKVARYAMEIGYYGGVIPSGEVVESTGEVFTQEVDLINEEELYLQVRIPLQSREGLTIGYSIVVGGTEVKSDKLTLVTLDGNGYLKSYLLLDSMKDGYDFETLMDSELPTGALGDELTITVTSTYEDASGVIHVEEDTVTGNSLFGNETNDNVIEVRTLRHLMNLKKGNTAGKTIQITDSIDFNNKDFCWNYEGSDPAYIGPGRQCPTNEFYSIANSDLFENAAIEGNNNVIMNMVLKGTSNDVGLFAKTKNTTIQNLRLEDVTINASECNNVGALVGYMEGGVIKNCGVHLSTYETDESGNTKAYIDEEDTCGVVTHANLMDHRYDNMTISGASNVGGLVGYATSSAQIGIETGTAPELVVKEGNYAAIQVKASGSNAGGLVGKAENSTIKNSYASGNVVANTNAGGFIGNVSSVTISNSYAVGDVSAENAGGFAGSGAGTYTDCISYGLVTGTTASGFAKAGTVSNCKYLKQNGYNVNCTDAENVEVALYSSLLAQTNKISASNVYTYCKELDEKSFPFEAITGHALYYGNWPAENKRETYLLYYEKYATKAEGQNDYGYYGVITMEGYDGEWIIDTLRTDGSVVVEDGYGLLSKYNLGEMQFTLSQVDNNNEIGTADVDTASAESVSLVGKADGSVEDAMNFSGAYFYKLPSEVQNPEFAKVSKFYNKLVVNAGLKGISGVNVIDKATFFFNPYFAKTAVNGVVEVPQTLPTDISIRSARQFNALGNQSYISAIDGVTYTQECDIDFTNYNGGNWTWSNKTIETVNSYDAGHTGGSYKIIGYTSSESMFGDNAGSIKNLIISNATLAGFVETNNNIVDNIQFKNVTSTAKLIDTNSNGATIKNIVIANDSQKSIAGFVGTNAGTIGADDTTITIGNLASNVSLIQSNTETGTIKNVNVSDCTVNTSADVALFVYDNDNVIENVTITGTTSIESTANKAYGFVADNAGTITNVSVVGTAATDTTPAIPIKVTGKTGGAGFVGVNTSTGVIGTDKTNISITILESNVALVYENTGKIKKVTVSNCTITGASDTALFVHTNNGTIGNEIDSNGNDQTGTDNVQEYGVEVINSSITGKSDIAGFVHTNAGTISNCSVYGTDSYDGTSITGDSAYGFAVRNEKSILASYVAGTVIANDGAAVGFVGENEGDIVIAYANTMLYALKENSSLAAGFVLTQTAGNIQASYAVSPEVNAETACGFAHQITNGGIIGCYTLACVDKGTDNYGFAKEAAQGVITDSYWCYDEESEHNKNVEAATSAEKKLLYTVYNADSNVEAVAYKDDLEGKKYPYESFGLKHYGDWPLYKQTQVGGTSSDDEVDEDDKLIDGVAENLVVEIEGNIVLLRNYEYRAIFYYEEYSNGDIGVYAVGLRDTTTRILIGILGTYETLDTTPNVIINTLRKESTNKCGYGVLYKDEISISVNENGEPMETYDIGRGANRADELKNIVSDVENEHYYRFIGDKVTTATDSYVRYIFNEDTPIKVEITATEIQNAKNNAAQ